MPHPRPCPRYRVNTAADTFGACRCGWPKNEHTPEAMHYAAAKTELKRVDSSVLRSKMTFSYNPEHKEVSKSRKVIRDAAEVRAGFVQRGKIECARFVVDVEASEFGMCICGGHRADHTEEALKPQGSLGTKTDSDRDEALRLRMTGRERVDCSLYEVDVSPDVPFGTCRACGFRRAQHSPEALIAAATAKGASNINVDEATVRAQMQARRAKCDALAPGA